MRVRLFLIALVTLNLPSFSQIKDVPIDPGQDPRLKADVLLVVAHPDVRLRSAVYLQSSCLMTKSELKLTSLVTASGIARAGDDLENGVTVKTPAGSVSVEIFTEGLFESRSTLKVSSRCGKASSWRKNGRRSCLKSESKDWIELRTKKIAARIRRSSGAVSFHDARGQILRTHS